MYSISAGGFCIHFLHGTPAWHGTFSDTCYNSPQKFSGREGFTVGRCTKDWHFPLLFLSDTAHRDLGAFYSLLLAFILTLSLLLLQLSHSQRHLQLHHSAVTPRLSFLIRLFGFVRHAVSYFLSSSCALATMTLSGFASVLLCSFRFCVYTVSSLLFCMCL